MIFFFSVVLVLMVFMNFSMSASKMNFVYMYSIFVEIKMVSFFFVKLMSGMIVFLVLNYNSYIYYSVGLTMHYGYVFVYALSMVIVLWSLWVVNSVKSMLSHYLPLGVEGLLKLFIPLIEILGVLIRPLTLAVRLATNISCGHVVLLMFSFFVFNMSNYLVLSISILLFGLYFIEFLVCVIQAYVFWSLIYIYLMEMEI